MDLNKKSGDSGVKGGVLGGGSGVEEMCAYTGSGKPGVLSDNSCRTDLWKK